MAAPALELAPAKPSADPTSIEDMLRLSPIQEGMLFHSLRSARSGLYVSQSSSIYRDRDFDEDAFIKAWQGVVQRHPALRTAFVWEGLDEPVQVVLRAVELPLVRLDLRVLSVAGRERQVAALLEEDFAKPFELHRAPLMRLLLLRLDDDRWQLVWTCHHLVMDGWSETLVEQDLLTIYQQLRNGRPATLPPAVSYGDYVSWLEGQDMAEAEAFWRRTLSHLRLPTPLDEDPVEGPPRVAAERWMLSVAELENLAGFARSHGLTLNTVVAGTWALVLSAPLGLSRVVFGTTVSGRSAQLAGVEGIVGPLLNTLPARVDVFPEAALAPWLLALQERLVHLRRFEHSSLTRIGQWAETGSERALFESLLVFQNAPRAARVVSDGQGASLEGGAFRQGSTEYPICLEVVPDSQLHLMLTYDPSRFRGSTIRSRLKLLAGLLREIGGRSPRRVGDLLSFIADHSDRELEAGARRLSELGAADLERLSKTDPTGPVVWRASYEQRALHRLRGQISGAGLSLLRLEIEDQVETVDLEQSLRAVVERHELLRTRFRGSEDDLGATVLPPEKVLLVVNDLCPSSSEAGSVRRNWLAGLDGEGPLAALWLAGNATASGEMVLALPALAADAVSLEILGREIADELFLRCAGDRCTGDAAADQDTTREDLPYALVASWQERLSAAEEGETGRRFWRQQRPDPELLAACHLPFERLVPAGAPARMERWRLVLGPGRLAAAVRLAAAGGGDLGDVVMAAWAILLARLLDQPRIAVAMVSDGREQKALRRVLGPLEKALPLEITPGAVGSGAELVASIAARRRRYLGFADVYPDGVAGPETSGGWWPFGFAVRSVAEPLRSGPMRLRRRGRNAFPGGALVTLELVVHGGGAAGSSQGDLELVYDSCHFAAEDVYRLGGQVATVLSTLVKQPQMPVGELDLLSDSERQWLLREVNAPGFDRLRPRTLVEVFEDRARRCPGAVAIARDGEQVTYGELDRRSNRLARRLCAMGVGPESLVGVCLRRAPRLIEAMVGIQKAGGAYVPLDPSYPQERLRWILEDAGWPVVVTDEEFLPLLSDDGRQRVCLDRDACVLAQESGEPPAVPIRPDHLAYLIYTSGSTGRPKGVAICHGSAAVLLAWAAVEFDRELTAGVLASTSISFDLSVFEIFGTLAHGGRVILAETALYLPELVERDRVGLVNTVPSAMAELVRWRPLPPSVRTVNLAGEPLRRALVEEIFERSPWVERVLNLYGPSEDTTYSTYASVLCRDTREPSIGGPVAGTRMYVLGRAGGLTLPGAVGELYLGGRGLARGYYERPGLTAERFQPDPWGEEPGGRLYWTGDLVRHRQDGMLEFLGRRDHQVKVRGFRIELGEIEALLRRQAGVRDAVVVRHEDASGTVRLVAYVEIAGRNGGERRAGELRQTLSSSLPVYMVPDLVLCLDFFPRTPNGKIDRQALPPPRFGSADHTAARTVVEEVLEEIWRDLLGCEVVGVHQRFFDLGGHSLLAMRLVARVQRAFGISLPMSAVFESPTIAELAERIEAAGLAPALPPILPAPIGRSLPLAASQRRFWLLQKLAPESSLLNLGGAVLLSGQLYPRALERALVEIRRRHAVLRTRFVEQDGEPVQVIEAPRATPLPRIDLRGLPGRRRREVLERLVRVEQRRPFDLAADPPTRLLLVILNAEVCALVLVQHHIITDGWSMGIFGHELSLLYKAFSRGEVSPLPEPEIQYADFAVWQNANVENSASLEYWCRELAGAPVFLELPTDRPRPLVITSGTSLPLRLSSVTWEEVSAKARRSSCTPFMLLLVVWQTLLARFSGQGDLVVGVPIAGRDRPEVQSLIGCFINLLALRGTFAEDISFERLLNRTRQRVLAAYAHQDFPFDRLVEVLGVERSLDRHPLFQVLFDLRRQSENVSLAGLELDTVEGDAGGVGYDLSLQLSPAGGSITGRLVYRSDLFDRTTIERFVLRFERLLSAVMTDPTCRLLRLDLLTEAERHMLLAELNDSETAGGSWLVPEQIVSQARRRPHKIALVNGDRHVSFGELGRQAGHLAGRLQEIGVRTEQPVAICLHRCLEQAVAMLGIWQAGGAVLLIDPSYPSERQRWMLQDGGAAAILGRRAELLQLADSGLAAVELDRPLKGTAASDSPGFQRPQSPQQLCYVIYTSGSTGQPKAVMVPHLGLANLAAWCRRHYGIQPDDRANLIAGPAFDAVMMELCPYLALGATVHVLSGPEADRPEELFAWIGRCRLTLCHVAVPLLEAALSGGTIAATSLRVLSTGGARLHASSRGRVSAAFYNLYGPTEASVICTAHRVRADVGESLDPAIGRPHRNTEVHVASPHLELLPLGMEGELLVGGSNLARGYRDRPALTAAAFVPDPWSHRPGRRLYRTGDRVRRRGDGVLRFVGRADRQVKIRGIRVEPAEVESRLEEHPEVLQAVVVALEQPAGETCLAAYVVPRNSENLGGMESQVRSYLRGRLPEGMVPASVTILPEIPLTPNGKVDYSALSVPDRGVVAPETPRNAIESVLHEIWLGLLGLKQIGLNDSFFEVGGHSLLAMRLLSRIHSKLGVELPLSAVFESPTVAGLAERVSTLARRPRLPAIVRRSGRQHPPLSSAQERLFFLQSLYPESSMYNVPVATAMRGTVQPEVLAAALGELVRRHEVLRTRFVLDDEEPRQIVEPPRPVALGMVDLSALAEPDWRREMRRIAERQQRLPFDLSRAPQWRACLLRIDDGRSVLLMTLHHIITDAWSSAVLRRELWHLYEAVAEGRPVSLPELNVQYTDFASWQREWLAGPGPNAALAAWQEALAGAPALLEIPTDRPRPPVMGEAGDSIGWGLPAASAAALRRVAEQTSCTLFMVFLTAWQVLLAHRSGQRDVVVGVPIAGRSRSEIEGLIGCFINLLPIRVRVDGSDSFESLLLAVRQQLLMAYDYQDLPFERLVEVLQVDRAPDRHPIFQVAFNLISGEAAGQPVVGSELVVGPLDVAVDRVRFDLMLEVDDFGSRSRMGLQYRKDLFDRSTMERLARQIRYFLAELPSVFDHAVDRLPFLPPLERHQILCEWSGLGGAPEAGCRCLPQSFEDRAARSPEAVALVDADGGTVTFRELNRRANRLAHALLARGLGAEARVGLALERSPELVTALLGVAKAGAAYVPLEPTYPDEHLHWLASDAGLDLILTDATMTARFVGVRRALPVAEFDTLLRSSEREENLPFTARPDSLVYVLYTSGSTGRPKGVMVSHASLASYLGWALDFYRPHEVGAAFVHSPLAFDLTVTSLLLPLLAGQPVRLLPGDKGGEGLVQALQTGGNCGLLKLTPSHLDLLAEYLTPRDLAGGVRLLVVGGEALKRSSVVDWWQLSPVSRVVNEYGPTETVVGCSVHELLPGQGSAEPVPIGRPIAGAHLLLFDDAFEPVPVGVAAEIHIGGPAVARGYLGRPGLTAERFVPDAWSGRRGARLYRTGDRACWRPTGVIDFLGRLDDQVKLRGHRIELGEIEARLRQAPEVREAAVVLRHERLLAYLVIDGDEESAFDGDRWLRDRLPEHMVPAAFIQLDDLPLTTNGKLDRARLPDPDWREGAVPPAAARNVLELRLQQLFERLLGVVPVGVHDDFFALGGHSLLAQRLMVRVERLLGQRVPLAVFLQCPTVAHLARCLSDGEVVYESSALVPIQTSGEHPGLFCVHPLGGEVLVFFELGRNIGSDQPLYALQASHPSEMEPPYPSIVEMAATYLQAIRQVQPEGPYHLAGFSYGCAIAFEMARQLHAAAAEVGLLALFDGQPPGTLRSHDEGADALLLAGLGRDLAQETGKTVAIDYDEVRRRDRDSAVRYIVDQLQAAEVIPPDVGVAWADRFLRGVRARLEAFDAYQPEPFDGVITFFRAERIDADTAEVLRQQGIDVRTAAERWSRLSRQLVIEEIPGHHATMLREPAVAHLADRLRRLLSLQRHDPGGDLEKVRQSRRSR